MTQRCAERHLGCGTGARRCHALAPQPGHRQVEQNAPGRFIQQTRVDELAAALPALDDFHAKIVEIGEGWFSGHSGLDCGVGSKLKPLGMDRRHAELLSKPGPA